MANQIKFLKSQKARQEKNFREEKLSLSKMNSIYKNFTGDLLNTVSILARNFTLMKKELNLALNKLRKEMDHAVGQELLQDVSLIEVIKGLDMKIKRCDVLDIKRKYQSLKNQLNSVEKLFSFGKSQKLYEKNLIKIRKFNNKNESFAQDDNFSELSKIFL